jgi:hypothetical protein
VKVKKITITEEQLHRLFEENTASGPTLNGGDLKEYPGSEVMTNANVTDSDGDLKYGKPKTADKVQKDICNNSFWANPTRGIRV